MKPAFKNNFFGYFIFYYRVLGVRIFINLFLCTLVSFMDSIGLAMFMPLLQLFGSGDSTSVSMGNLHYLTDVIQAVGFELTFQTVLITIVLAFSMKGIFKYVQLIYQVNIRHLFMRKVRYELVSNLQSLSYQGFVNMDAGRIQNTLISEVQRLFQTMNSYFNAVQFMVMLLTYVVLAFLTNYQFAILVAAGGGLTNFLYRKVYVEVKRASRELSKKGDDFNGFLIQAIHHFKYLKATAYFNNFGKKLRRVIDQTELLNRKIGYYHAITTSFREPMIIGVVVLVIFVQTTWMNAAFDSILLSLMLFYRALTYLVVVQNHWQTFMQNVGAMFAVSDFTNEMTKMKETQQNEPFRSLNQEISFQDVRFSYGDKLILDSITLKIQKNKTIALVGESGSGKTTLANIVAGLIQPQTGSVYVDNSPLTSLNLDSYRSKIGYISQEPVIFNDDIYNNVTFWAEPTSENLQKFWQAVTLASLRDFIESQKDREQTRLGDNGLLISGGQKQRISIARELYKSAEILILDEATSALDSETERYIQENIDALHGAYTIIIIAHRLSTIRNADVIYLLDKGHISASGDFREMVNASLKFRRMVELQEF